MQTIDELWGEQGERMQTAAACRQFDTLTELVLVALADDVSIRACDDDLNRNLERTQRLCRPLLNLEVNPNRDSNRRHGRQHLRW